jgi:hypothetical protein
MTRQEAAREIAGLVDSDLQGVEETIRDLVNSISEIVSDPELNSRLKEQINRLEETLAEYEEFQEAEDHDMVVESTEEILDLILRIAQMVDPEGGNS